MRRWVPPKLKVLFLLGELRPSGGEAMLVSAAPLWLQTVEGHVLSTGAAVGVYADKLHDAGYRIHHLPFSKSPAFFSAFYRFLREQAFDIVHLHTERADVWYALIVRLAAGYGTPVIRTVHHLFRFDGFLRWRKLVERQFSHRVLKVNFVSNSPSGQRNEEERFGMRNLLIPNWYDSGRFLPPTPQQRMEARASLGLSAGTCVFVSLGGNWSYKNYDQIVDALALIRPDLDVLYLQVGVQGEAAPLEARGRELRVMHRLRCEGTVVDPLPYLFAADGYIMPSSEEGFGVAAAEAMATGLPAILGEVEALTDFREKVPGILFVDPVADAIAEAMSRMAKMTDEERRRLGEMQANATRASYRLDTGPVAYLELFHELAKRQ